MIKLKAIQDFTLKDYKKLKNMQSKKQTEKTTKYIIKTYLNVMKKWQDIY